MSSLQGKRAIVTGGSRGIGAAIARRLAAEGADVAIIYERSAERAGAVARSIEATGRKSLAIQADSADPAAVRAVWTRCRGLAVSTSWSTTRAFPERRHRRHDAGRRRLDLGRQRGRTVVRRSQAPRRTWARWPDHLDRSCFGGTGGRARIPSLYALSTAPSSSGPGLARASDQEASPSTLPSRLDRSE